MHEAEDLMLCLEHEQLANETVDERQPHQQQPALPLNQQPLGQRAYAHMEAFGQHLLVVQAMPPDE